MTFPWLGDSHIATQVDKYEAGIFGLCPRVYCQGTNVVPSGRSDLPGLDTVKLYCPNCHDIYAPPSSRYQGVDGIDPQCFLQSCQGIDSEPRRILWHNLPTSILPKLPRTRPGSLLQTSNWTKRRHLPNREQLLPSIHIHESQPTRGTKTGGG